ncbi:MAG: hypothetical protein ACTS3T_21595 [Almyronema sp.]
MPTIDALISITFYGGLGYIGLAAIVHAFYWTEKRLTEQQTSIQTDAVSASEPVVQAVEAEEAPVVLPKPPVKTKQTVTQPVYTSF